MGVHEEIEWVEIMKMLLAKVGSTSDRRKIYKIVKPVYGRQRMMAYGYNGRLSRRLFRRICRDYTAGAMFWDALTTWIQ